LAASCFALPFELFGFAFGLHLLVADDLADRALHLAAEFFGGAFASLARIAHDRSPCRDTSRVPHGLVTPYDEQSPCRPASERGETAICASLGSVARRFGSDRAQMQRFISPHLDRARVRGYGVS
jgi:hypothetical protein